MTQQLTSLICDPTCFLCAGANSGGKDWYDEVLLANDAAVVLPALGALVAGHVLVAPRSHVLSAQDMPADARAGFVQCLEQVVRRLHRENGQVTVFEHGAAIAGSGPRSACSEHAHVQVLPGQYGLHRALEYELSYESLDAFYGGAPPFYPYLLVHETGGQTLVARDVGHSQFFRRVLAAELGDPDRWDYWVFPRHANVRETITLFAGG